MHDVRSLVCKIKVLTVRVAVPGTWKWTIHSLTYLWPSIGLPLRASIIPNIFWSLRMSRISGLDNISCILLSSSAVGWCGLVELRTDKSAPPVGDFVYTVLLLDWCTEADVFLDFCGFTSESVSLSSSTILLVDLFEVCLLSWSCFSAKFEKCSPENKLTCYNNTNQNNTKIFLTVKGFTFVHLNFHVTKRCPKTTELIGRKHVNKQELYSEDRAATISK